MVTWNLLKINSTNGLVPSGKQLVTDSDIFLKRQASTWTSVDLSSGRSHGKQIN